MKKKFNWENYLKSLIAIRKFLIIHSGPIMEPEELRWQKYLLSLDELVFSGKISFAQRKSFLDIWNKAKEKYPTLRYPVVYITDDDDIYCYWSFTKPKDIILDFSIVKNGYVDWFYDNRNNDIVMGTEEDPEEKLPDIVWPLFEHWALKE